MAGLFKNKDGSKKKFVEKFEQSGFGKFVKEKLPALADKVADFLPDKGGLGIIKHILDQDQKVKEEFQALSAEDQMKFWQFKSQFVLEMAKVEAQDLADARARQIAMAGKGDWLMNVVGLTVVVAFLLLETMQLIDPNKYKDNAQITHLTAIVEAAMFAVIGFYFGASLGSRRKTELMAEQNKEKDPA